MPTEQTVYIVDDDDNYRNSLSELLKDANMPVKTFNSAHELLEVSLSSIKGCVLLDLMMPAYTGFDLLKDLQLRDFAPPIIVISGMSDTQSVVKAIKLGAFDFIEKPVTEKQLLAKIQKAFSFNIENSPVCAILKLNKLTSREKEVLRHLTKKLTSKMIAKELGISYRTVEVHRKSILEKLNIGSLKDLHKVFGELTRIDKSALK